MPSGVVRGLFYIRERRGIQVSEATISEVNSIVEDTTKALMGIQIQLARMEKTLEGVPAMAATLEATRDLARESMQSTKSAHHRLDKIENNQTWLWRTIATTLIGIAIGAIVLILKTGGA